MNDIDKLEFKQKIGLAVKTYRLSKNYTLEKLAIESGIEYSQISRIERGIINTSVYHLYIISKTLKIPLHQLLQGV